MMMRAAILLLLAGCSAAPAGNRNGPPPAPSAGRRISCTVEAEGGDPASFDGAGASAFSVKRSGTHVEVSAKGAIAGARDLEVFLKGVDDLLTRSQAGPRIYRLTISDVSLDRAAQAFSALEIRGITATLADAAGRTTSRRVESGAELKALGEVRSAYGAAPPSQLTYNPPRLLLFSRTDAPLLKVADAVQ